ncbi:hypothetical protein K503DRAFT_806095 [Rhizopogon vinicolor AM-OR11-026]|uniref:Uncharacterized protein n=1 Tax=Rhizopogon vinicolor AM-OR11-026 TaxID=1314800 RepID=A0A1B7MFM8_9AGAM|nr:hypothetical protein K503DRAFT_806095 [Rhizopogon vinicolor AM-OR11-026]
MGHISNQGSQAGDGSFRQILEQCMGQGCSDIALSFQTMIAQIKLVIMWLTDRCSTRTVMHQSLEEVYKVDVAPLKNKPSYRTFQHWYTIGTRFVAVAGGGTIDLTYHLGNALRNPDPDTKIGATIIAKIIPVIHLLQGMFMMTIYATFPPSMLATHNIPPQIYCANITVSDLFFDSFIFNMFKLVEHSPSSWDPSKSRHLGIEFPASFPENAKMPMPQESAADAVWSEHEHKLAEHAAVVEDLVDLSSELENFYTNGVKPMDSYIHIPNSLIRGAMKQRWYFDGIHLRHSSRPPASLSDEQLGTLL